MDSNPVTIEIEAALAAQQQIIGNDAALDGAVAAFAAVLEPAMRAATLRLAEQAAAEVSAQLPDQRVDVVVEDGEPRLAVQADADPVPETGGELEARITLRLPQVLKDDIETAATDRGESVNTYLVRTLTADVRSARRRAGRSFRGTIRT
jgi:hypothetical protein